MKLLQDGTRRLCSVVFFTFLLSFAAQSWCVEPCEPLVGSWVSTKHSKGGIRDVHDYGGNGVFVSRLSVMLGYFYKFTDSKLILTPATAEEGEPLEYTVAFEGSSLTLKSPTENDARVLRREPEERSSDEQTGLLGTWSFTDNNKTTGYYTFRPDGRLYFQIPLPGEVIRQYLVEGDEIILKDRKDRTVEERMKFAIQGDTLILRSVDGKSEHQYKKMKAIKLLTK